MHTPSHSLSLCPHSLSAQCTQGWTDILKHECRHTLLCSISLCPHLGYACIHMHTHSECAQQLLWLYCQCWVLKKQNKKTLRPLFLFHAMHTRKSWSITATWQTCFHRNTQTLKPSSLPHLFSFHQLNFKAHFVSSATVPPFLPLPCSFPRLPLLSLQPSPTAGGEIISNTPSLVLALPYSLPPFSPMLAHSNTLLTTLSFFLIYFFYLHTFLN